MIRHYTIHKHVNDDHEHLIVVTVYEKAMSKKKIKRLDHFTKTFGKVVFDDKKPTASAHL